MNTTLRQKLVREGVLIERGFRLPVVRHSKRVLRLDSAGRAEAERACRDRRILSGMPGLDEVLQRRPLFGRRAPQIPRPDAQNVASVRS